MVERFNGRIAELLKSTHFRSAQELAIALWHYLRLYNGQIPQRALGHVCPIQALKNWYEKAPERFNFRVYNLAGLDNNLVSLDYRYHCQDAQNRLLFRYDNAPHFPDLASFPHHKHLPDDTVESEKPTIFQVLKESEAMSG
jgi:hypothetical protein